MESTESDRHLPPSTIAMRIHLTLHPSAFPPNATAGPSSGPLAQLGGEVVLVELQGELGWEGEKAGGVVGVIGLDRPDKPTLHLGPHHLLHGKFANLPKPLAVIRRGVVSRSTADGGAVLGDAAAEEEEEEEDEQEGLENEGRGAEIITPQRPSRIGTGQTKKRKLANGSASRRQEDSDDEDEPPLFPRNTVYDPVTPERSEHPSSSSPFLPPSSMKDFSSEIDFSSPPPSSPLYGDEADGEEEEEEGEERVLQREAEKRRSEKLEKKRAERKASRPERTRVYEVISVVRRKVVFALRPEPIVTATILPD